jgi:hypothetical protein
MASEPISTAYFINSSHQSVFICVFPRIVVRQRLGRHVPVTKNTRNNIRVVGGVVSYKVRVISKESLWVCLCIPSSLPGNGSVNTFPRQQRIVEGVVFYAVRVVSKESMRSVLPRISCLSIS